MSRLTLTREMGAGQPSSDGRIVLTEGGIVLKLWYSWYMYLPVCLLVCLYVKNDNEGGTV